MRAFSVDGRELREKSVLFDQVCDEFADSNGLKYTMEPAQVGHDELAAALARFHDSSRRATDALHADTSAAARLLVLNATAYRDADREIQDTLERHVGGR